MSLSTFTPRPQPTVLTGTAVPACGSLVDRSVRGRDQAGSIPATPTKEAVTVSGPKATTIEAGIPTGTIVAIVDTMGAAKRENNEATIYS